MLIPFMEFLLPVALKVFPNMLPSTFQVQRFTGYFVGTSCDSVLMASIAFPDRPQGTY